MAIKQWNYLTAEVQAGFSGLLFRIGSSNKVTLVNLETLGDEGWEFVAVIAGATVGSQYAVFKRPREEAQHGED